MSYIYQPIQYDPPKKWCGCPTYMFCSHPYPTQVHVWPSTGTTPKFPEKLDDGYVGRHRKPDA